MEDTNFADSTVHSASDISGVKSAALPDPEGIKDGEPCDAGKENNASSDGETDLAALEKEFEELISGRFKQVYKKRTEGIIRKRLSGRAHPARAEKDTLSERKDAEASESQPENIKEEPPVKNEAVNGTDRADAARAMNKTRPIENGLSGSCGVITKINVSALNGRDVLSILKRVGAGEKIDFK